MLESKTLFNVIKHAKNTCQNITNYSVKVTTDPASFKEYKRKFHGRYIGIPFEASRVTKGIRMSYMVDGTSIECELIQVEDGKRLDVRCVGKILNRLNMMVIMLNRMCRHIDRVKITMVLNPHEKQAPVQRNAHFCAQHVNNGLTSFSKGIPEYIYIYRFEDLYKVMMHELIHYYGFDFGRVLDVHDKFKSFCIRDLSGQIDLNEAYTETLACYLWIAMHTYISHSPKNDRVHYTHIQRRVQQSRDFFCKTVVGILVHFGLADLNQRDECKHYITQDTHVFSYFICKAALFFCMPRFLEIVQIGPDRNAFISLVYDALLDTSFTKSLEQAIPTRSMRMIDM